MTEVTKREEFENLVKELSADEAVAIKELHDSMTTGNGQRFISQIKNTLNRTVPGSVFDQVLTSLLTTLNNTVNLTAPRAAPTDTVEA